MQGFVEVGEHTLQEWPLNTINYGTHLVEVVQGFVEVGEHAGGRLVRDLDCGLQDALGNDMRIRATGWLRADEQPVTLMAIFRVLLNFLLQLGQPLRHQVNVLPVSYTHLTLPTT